MNATLKDKSGNGHHGTLVGFATRPEESAHPELWEGLRDRGGAWHRAADGPWSLDFNGDDQHVVAGSPVDWNKVVAVSKEE